MARSFDGATQWAVNSNAFSNGATDYTYSIWLLLNNTTQSPRIFGQGSAAGGAQQYISFNTDAQGTVFVASADHQATFAIGNSTPSTNTWYNVICVYVNATPILTLYINGVAQTQTANGAFATGNDTVSLSTNPQQTAAHLNGFAADAAMWNVALSAGEILALSKGARPYTIRQQSLKRYYPLDGLNSPEPDLSGGAFNFTLTGSPPLAAGPPIMMFTPRWPQFNPVTAVTVKPYPPFQLRAA